MNLTMSAAETPRLPPTFNRLAWSNLAAQSAEQVALAAAPIVAVLLLGVGEGQTGLLQTALTLPFILFAIPAGLLADRLSRRAVMAGSEALRAAALAGILLLLWLNLMTLPLLALLGFVAVCGTVAYSVAAPALVPSLVNAQQLPAANARIELARTVAFASGPALGGVLVGWVGAAPAFGFATALSVIAVVLLSGIYEPARSPAPRRHPLQDIKEGAAFVLHHPLLRPVFITQFIFNTASFLLLAVFVPYAVRHLGLSATGVGTTLAMYGVGMVVGALSATRVMKRFAFGTVIGLGPVTGFVAACVMALTTVVPMALLAGVSFFLLGVGPILWVISTTTLRQSVTPPSLLGRVSAINIMSYGARPLGSMLGAVVGGFYGAEACLYLAAAIFAVQALVILASPAVSLARQPDMVGDGPAVLRAC
ncbi:MFS transporter [Bradyrhizobium lablabi]|uniref:MFS transporter n=1 Tax=Bradyrhizobium lablabi TaxID=722472 RepID=UPI0009096FC9|nr:MFS transporter [Bradyrhizobium lablabi]SHM57199.1 Predicted arabinose efflux permease, MFS family [Bradyrhizobium lablabi]